MTPALIGRSGDPDADGGDTAAAAIAPADGGRTAAAADDADSVVAAAAPATSSLEARLYEKSPSRSPPPPYAVKNVFAPDPRFRGAVGDPLKPLLALEDPEKYPEEENR